MDLYATGFNAWNQLHFHSQTDEANQDRSSKSPEDLYDLHAVLSVPDEILCVYASLSRTIGPFQLPRCAPCLQTNTALSEQVKTKAGEVSAGFPEPWEEDQDLGDKVVAQTASIAGNGMFVGMPFLHLHQSPQGD